MNMALAGTPLQNRLFEAPAQADDDFGIYIHIPFCAHICPYCDFNTYAGQSERIPSYVEAIAQEIEQWAPQFAGRSATSIFLGGGTPSLLSPDQILDVQIACRGSFDIALDAEVSIETNP